MAVVWHTRWLECGHSLLNVVPILSIDHYSEHLVQRLWPSEQMLLVLVSGWVQDSSRTVDPIFVRLFGIISQYIFNFSSKFFLAGWGKRNWWKCWCMQVGYTDLLIVHIFSLGNCITTLLISAMTGYVLESFLSNCNIKMYLALMYYWLQIQCMIFKCSVNVNANCVCRHCQFFELCWL
jgi:hypothetical protein